MKGPIGAMVNQFFSISLSLSFSLSLIPSPYFSAPEIRVQVQLSTVKLASAD